ncbi:MAG TPA: hypothetical protein VGF95_09315 [Solirubrobacteraceae bacterium]|jgi:hypothetical protein
MRPATAVAFSCLALGGAMLAPAVATAKSSKATKVTVEVLGKPPKHETLLKRTVTLTSKPVAKYGGSCSGESAAGALQLATKGTWGGSWDAEYSDYEVTKIAGLNLPFKSKAAANWYWSFWVGGKQASAGVCEVDPKNGQTVLFEPACYGKACPKTPKKTSAKGSAAAADARGRR